MKLTEIELKELEDYKKLNQEEKDEYLETNGLIITGIIDNTDGSVNMEMDLGDKAEKVLTDYMNENGLKDMSEAMSEILKNQIATYEKSNGKNTKKTN